MAHLAPTAIPIPINQGQLTLFEDILSPDESRSVFNRLIRHVDWQQETLFLFGRHILTPRLTAWYGDAAYTYSGLMHPPRPLLPVLDELRNLVESLSGATFNTVLLNQYRDGSDSMSWHRDDEPELGQNPVIASLSLGGTRRFRLRNSKDKTQTHSIDLKDASLLLMGGSLQHNWHHALPKTKKPVAPRLNLTFRHIAN